MVWGWSINNQGVMGCWDFLFRCNNQSFSFSLAFLGSIEAIYWKLSLDSKKRGSKAVHLLNNLLNEQ